MKRTEYLVGFDIGGTKCAAILGRFSSGEKPEIVARAAFATAETVAPAPTLEKLAQIARDLTAQHGVQRTQLRGAGISCGGPLDSARGVIFSPPNLPGWDAVPVTHILGQALGLEVALQNDANAGALAEWQWGAARGAQTAAFLTFGTGLGAGLILNGQLHPGPDDLAGELGHWRLANEGPVGFGKAGSFEGFCSGGGLARLAAFRAGHELDAAPDAQTLALRALEGDEEARAIFEIAGAHLGQGLALLIDLLNPEVIAIGGVFARCESLLRPAMERVLEAETLPDALKRCRIVSAALGETIGDYAALAVAMQSGQQSEICINQPLCPSSQEADFTPLLARYPILAPCLADLEAAFGCLREAFARGDKLLLCGNGGSAADAEHIAGELMKGFLLPRALPDARRRHLSDIAGEDLGQSLQEALPALALTGQIALSTAVANDNRGDMAFAQQVYGLGRRGDVLLGLSTSGNSQNVVNAFHVAHLRGLRTVALTGAEGGALGRLADVAIRVPAQLVTEIQELHLPVYHALCIALETAFFSQSAN